MPTSIKSLMYGNLTKSFAIDHKHVDIVQDINDGLLSETQIIDIRFDLLNKTATFVIDTRQAINLSIGDTVILKPSGVNETTYTCETVKLSVVNIIGVDITKLKDDYKMLMYLFYDGRITVHFKSAMFLNGISMHGAPIPDLSVEDPTKGVNGFPNIYSEIEVISTIDFGC